ncbi:mitochondrial fission ELM1 family protein [Luteolibacter sp. LG18]|uniref:mitochondrial fission ELM1 family protein n=1 Tax=Luteolibacter sp. LG18 TaxID=2819286 RepID=UPI002B2F4579|nr:nucleoside-diphosphate sugar epimerase [Luteolibacter sp. LG18]
MNSPFVIWQLGDGKPGHENQSLGLAEAIGRRIPVAVHRIDLSGGERLIARLRSTFRQSREFPAPSLIVGAGHATHVPMIGLARRTGTPCVVLMKPSLPAGLFDLCLVPRHDLRGVPGGNIVPTVGALNRVHVADGTPKSGRMILIGGPSSTHGWDTEGTLRALADIVASAPEATWTLTDSRRTPEGVRAKIRSRFPRIELFPHEETDRGWLPDRLAAAAEAWVTEDSISMIYESLTSGARVGLLPVPRQKTGRVARGIDRLVADGFATPYDTWKHDGVLPPPGQVLREADRCAGLILERWYPQAR